MRSLSACCTLLLATLLTGCGSSSAPPTLKSGPELVLRGSALAPTLVNRTPCRRCP